MTSFSHKKCMGVSLSIVLMDNGLFISHTRSAVVTSALRKIFTVSASVFEISTALSY